MVIIYLKGGLGNQLFQYGFGIFLKKKLKAKVYFDISHFQDLQNLHSKYPRTLKINKLFKNFQIPFYSKFQICLQRVNLFNNLAISFPKLFCKSFDENRDLIFVNNCIYNGYWQNIKYLTEVRDEILAEYINMNLVNPFSNKVNFYFNLISNDPNSVCVHIRLGDLFYNNIEDRLDDLYYRSAIADNFKNPNYNFYVFSENINVCREMLVGCNVNLIFIEIENSEYQDLYEFELMRLCKNFIISKSTFSWMSYFLSDAYNKPSVFIKPLNFLI